MRIAIFVLNHKIYLKILSTWIIHGNNSNLTVEEIHKLLISFKKKFQLKSHDFFVYFFFDPLIQKYTSIKKFPFLWNTNIRGYGYYSRIL